MYHGSASCFAQMSDQYYGPFLNAGSAGEGDVLEDDLKGLSKLRAG